MIRSGCNLGRMSVPARGLARRPRSGSSGGGTASVHVADPPSESQLTPRYPDCGTLVTKRNAASLQGTHCNPGTDDGVESVLARLAFHAAVSVQLRPNFHRCEFLEKNSRKSGCSVHISEAAGSARQARPRAINDKGQARCSIRSFALTP
jgi:hypothetical protein